ncbi:MAG: hypothetical protein JNM72_05360 [Deltaproteobacteria bacterium]|jgi:hypothetical protein|nr:hypothetical protein [Deltaproteobacteria bacterium]
MPDNAPVTPHNTTPLAILTWNLNRDREALGALAARLLEPTCPWGAVLVQEWPEPKVVQPVDAAPAAEVADAEPEPAANQEGAPAGPTRDAEQGRESFRTTVEADLKSITKVAGALEARGWELGAATDGPGANGRRSVILARTRKPGDASWPISLRRSAEPPEKLDRRPKISEICWVTLEITDPDIGSTTLVLVVNVHATSQLTAAEGLDRLTRALVTSAAIKDLIQREQGVSLVIAGGDWNAEPWSDELSGVAFLGAARSAGELNRGYRSRIPASFYNPSWSLCQSAVGAHPAGTYFYWGEATRADRWKLYDQFVLNADAANRFLEGGKLRLVPDLSRHISFSGDGAPRARPSAKKRAKLGGSLAAEVPYSDHLPVELVIPLVHRFTETT